ncbi:hypothetical protein NBRC116188_03220 [Oceaniserpentilla sp. 4NH20-0058]|uniref:murein hydrolase activator EnvC family protein n=1 Tax=Oceaniserpentilla sp. 4NH20-0058 TaxID=3127660 RepID=UPI00310894CA
MQAQPKLIDLQKTDKKNINLKAQGSSRARFILGLNNKVSHIDKRLQRLEKTTDHVLRFSIGYKELGLTFILAILVFTSISLVLRDPHYNTQIHSTYSNNPEVINNVPVVQSANNNLSPTRPDQSINGPTQLKWPLERQPNITDIDYTNHKHGIELHAKLGDPVVAIEKGVVLYSGNAINSYGNLILIQHDNDIISVYGNNYSNYVTEGEPIGKGQLIAAVGESNGKQAKLYFEIRYKGKAQDPFVYFKK